MAHKVFYIGWYISDEDKDAYQGNVPGNLKMKYIVEQMINSGFTPHILSLAKSKRKGFYAANKKLLKQENAPITYLAGYNSGGRIGQKIDSFIKYIELFWTLLFVIKKNDKVVLYHSYPYTAFVAIIKSFLKYPITIEVEEIYGYSASKDRPWVRKEIEAIKKMDYFICVNDGMPKMLGLKEGSFVVSYGVGKIPQRTTPRRDDGKIHVVYAGTIESYKLGAFTAVESAKYLPDRFMLHVIGFGSEENILKLTSRIAEINKEIGNVRVEYNGFYSGRELDDFFFGCHIGLSSNVMRPNFANNSFPSKVITYMCHDLSVVLGYADAFYDVPMSNGWTFYHEFTPKAIADAIVSAHIVPEGFYHGAILKMNEDLQFFMKEKLLINSIPNRGGKS